ncbi:hypothetical protein B4U79_18436 [Dinothrombium tinctorium]|uniref:F-box domain-containing protein n=1 Tax=Dinothrombium tinctorium TaxID=1965070 RepID=A0A3S3NIH8_9ACAR|nr:hypothetical protein B4U79_18549 [Dinothrombium tinctorium]RWS02301.1 hypothetical protein B4U79_18501 [Dinothrombium tinctorium]RWS03301.1 hypothetical protein B4U79_18436 [Dinothrombium tinctorium]
MELAPEDLVKLHWFDPLLRSEIVYEMVSLEEKCECQMFQSRHRKFLCIKTALYSPYLHAQLEPCFLKGIYFKLFSVIRRNTEKLKEEVLFLNNINFDNDFSRDNTFKRMKSILSNYEPLIWICPEIFEKIAHKVNLLLRTCENQNCFVRSHFRYDCAFEMLNVLVKNTTIYPELCCSYDIYDHLAEVIGSYNWKMHCLGFQNKHFISKEDKVDIDLIYFDLNYYFGESPCEALFPPKYKVNFIRDCDFSHLRERLKSFHFNEELLFDDVKEFTQLASEIIIEYFEDLNFSKISNFICFRYPFYTDNDGFLNLDNFSLCPDEVLLQIFSFLSEKDLLSLRYVSKRMKRLSEEKLKDLPKTIILSDNSKIIELDYKAKLYKNVQKIRVKKLGLLTSKIPWNSINLIMSEAISKIKKLKLSTNINESEKILDAKDFPLLEKLSVDYTILSKQVFSFIANLSRLKALNLKNLFILEGCHIVLPSNVNSLKIRQCHIPSSSLHINQSKLEKFVFDSNLFDSQIFWERVNNEFRSLKTLTFTSSDRIISQTSFLENMENLTTIKLFVFDIILPENINVKPSVKHLEFCSVKLSDAKFSKIIYSFKNLEKLSLILNSKNHLFPLTIEKLRMMDQIKAIHVKEIFSKFQKSSIATEFFEAAKNCSELSISVYSQNLEKDVFLNIVKKFIDIEKKKTLICKLVISAVFDFHLKTCNLPENVIVNEFPWVEQEMKYFDIANMMEVVE